MTAMFSKPPKPPTILQPIVIPQADPDALKKAQKRAMVDQNSSSSRSSTVLAPSDKLGAG